MHYYRVKYSGEPGGVATRVLTVPRGGTLRERLDASLDRSGGPDACHPYRGHRDEKGYGSMSIHGERDSVHRWAWREAHGCDVPDGMVVRHKCDNPPCGNPRHLELGTDTDNMRDMYERGRAPDRRGEKHGGAILTWPEVREIRRQRAAHRISYQTLANRFGVKPTTIRSIVVNLSWKESA